VVPRRRQRGRRQDRQASHRRLNASQTDWKVELQSFPQAAYNDSVTAGALAGNLPTSSTSTAEHAELGLGRLHATADDR